MSLPFSGIMTHKQGPDSHPTPPKDNFFYRQTILVEPFGIPGVSGLENGRAQGADQTAGTLLGSGCVTALSAVHIRNCPQSRPR